jgi:thioredoxin-related protein
MSNNIKSKMKKSILFSLIFLVHIGLSGQGISFFEGTWQDAIAKAKAEDKLLFVDAYAQWCGPCKSMAKNVFTQQKVGDYFNENFVSLKLDMENEGVTFGHKYPVKAYPTLFFLDGEGKVVKTIVGGQQVDGLISAAMDANKKNDKSVKYEEKYKAGDRSYELMYDYVKALNAAGKPSQKIANDYLNSNPSLTEDQKIKFLVEAVTDADSKIFDQLLANKSKAIELVTQKYYDQKVNAALAAAVTKSMDFEMMTVFDQTMEKADKALDGDVATSFIGKSKMKFYASNKKMDLYNSACKDLGKKMSKDGDIMRYIAVDMMRQYKGDKAKTSDAAEYIQKAYNLKPSTELLNEVVNIMIYAEQVDKALKLVKKEREVAENEKKDLAIFDRLIDYLNSKKV